MDTKKFSVVFAVWLMFAPGARAAEPLTCFECEARLLGQGYATGPAEVELRDNVFVRHVGIIVGKTFWHCQDDSSDPYSAGNDFCVGMDADLAIKIGILAKPKK